VLHPLHRRGFLRSLAAGAAGVALSRTAFAQTGLEVKKLTDNFLLITGAGGNVLAVIGTEGVLLVNGGSAERSADLLALVAHHSGGKPVQFLFNTCWHPQHTGSNEALGKAGAKIIAHENTKLWLGTEIDCAWQKRTYEPNPKESLPNHTFYADVQKMTIGKEPVEYGYLPQAHTDGDIYVYFKQSNVLVTGDTVQPGRLPILDWICGGWIGGMQQAHRTLLDLANDSTKIIPGAGPVMTKAGLQANLDTVTKIREQLVKLMKQGLGPADMIEGKALKDFEGQLSGDPEQFLYTAYRGLWAHARELGGIV
jgi:glyoxylase-like metal-dependent hydrolase (beta-lactamase superfamily II)